MGWSGGYLATNFTNEGRGHRALHHSPAEAFGRERQPHRRGVPVGGELEYVDGGTLAQALSGSVCRHGRTAGRLLSGRRFAYNYKFDSIPTSQSV